MSLAAAALPALAQNDTSETQTPPGPGSGKTLLEAKPEKLILAIEGGPAPPSGVSAKDTAGDEGKSVTILWELSPADAPLDTLDPDVQPVLSYEMERSQSAGGPFENVGKASAGQTKFVDPAVENDKQYWYRVVAITAAGARGESTVVGPAVASPQWFAVKKWNQLLAAVILFGAVIFYIQMGRMGKKPYVRRIAGLDALEEAIGRATEMGRPILYVPGVHDMSEVQTVASMTILAHVARKTAAYETRILVPNRFSLVMTTARETVKEACLHAGRPDAYYEDDIFYVSDEQFGFVAGVAGLMVRDKPATCLYLGAFFAESLILAETGHSTGAIQIAGTAQPAQLPFFVAACDYTLIGEELFAASAYLSGEPQQLGSLKGQDVGKLVAMGGIVTGSILATAISFGFTGLQPVLDALTGLFSTN